MFSQVTALPQARPTGNPQRNPHLAHRFAARLHKSSTGLCTRGPARLVVGGEIACPDSRQQAAANAGRGKWTGRGVPSRAWHPQLVPWHASRQGSLPTGEAVPRRGGERQSPCRPGAVSAPRRPCKACPGCLQVPSAARAPPGQPSQVTAGGTHDLHAAHQREIFRRRSRP
jgi:hypothetical protein